MIIDIINKILCTIWNTLKQGVRMKKPKKTILSFVFYNSYLYSKYES